jgi:hypothetical protein
VVADVADVDEVHTGAASTEEELGDLDVWVNRGQCPRAVDRDRRPRHRRAAASVTRLLGTSVSSTPPGD